MKCHHFLAAHQVASVFLLKIVSAIQDNTVLVAKRNVLVLTESVMEVGQDFCHQKITILGKIMKNQT